MRIALGVSGGIAAYKACEVVRGLTEAGADVQVLMTANAQRFITPLTLQTLSGRKVWTDAWDLSDDETIKHIELTRGLAAFVVAPATANALGKFAHGVADDLLSTFYLAVTAPVVVAPAMNTRMWFHPATQQALAMLAGRGVAVVDPESGWLAERETGVGRLAAPATIVAAALSAARRSTQLAGKKVVLTAGPTREPIDPVRYLSNGSSGKMGYAIAAAAARRGAEVVLISGPVDIPPPYGVRMVPVMTSRQMREAVLAERAGAHAIFMVAAVSDYAPVEAARKIKKTGGPLTLVLDEGPDILAELGRTKGPEILVGFAAETDDLLIQAARKLETKNTDFIVANDIAAPGQGIGSDRNAVTILGRDGSRVDVPEGGKAAIAETILDRVLGGESRVSDPGEIRKALASWVGYLGEIGVRELDMRPRPGASAASPSAAPEAAPGRETLDAIREDLGDCRRCKLCGTRKNIVFGVGDPHARLMIIGEGPGADEDEQGEPFVGRAGQKLNEMIKAIGLERKDVFIANIVKCRPPGNRDPEPDEVATCSPFLFRQIEAIAPRAIVALGSPAAKTLLGTKEGITKIRGTWGSFRGIPVMPTFHPAYLLRAYTVENRRLVFEDLKAARRRIDEAS